MVRRGQLPGTFTIPVSGRFGRKIKIPIETVLKLEEQWQLDGGAAPQRPVKKPKAVAPSFHHFPELLSLDAEQPGVEYRGGDPDLDGRSV